MAVVYEDALSKLKSLYPTSIDLSLNRMKVLLEKLGNPHLSIPPVIHVAGTNGKGSTQAFIRSILNCAGYTCHAYTSPHLVEFTERIRIQDRIITPDYLNECLLKVLKANNNEPITFFEGVTAAAFLAFKDHPADFTLLETGMGGMYDATNVIDAPALTVITTIGLDHQTFLGKTLDEIAIQKAGIIKKGVPVVLSPQLEDVYLTLLYEARHRGAIIVNYENHVTKDGFMLNGNLYPFPNLVGEHQIVNASTALMAVSLLNKNISYEAQCQGITQANWPGRLQKITHGKLHSLLKGGQELWVDGAHNPQSSQALAKTLNTWLDKKVYVVFGMRNNRDPKEFIEPMAPYIYSVLCVPIENPAWQDATIPSHSPEELCKEVSFLCPTHFYRSIEDALMTLEEPCYILVTGSLHLVGEFLSKNGTPPE